MIGEWIIKIGIDNALGIHPQALQLRAERSEVLAGNIANADTPGFKARDIDFREVMATQMSRQNGPQNLRTSNPLHLQGDTTSTSYNTQDLKYRVPLMPSLDGNSVDVQLEQTEFAQNSMQFLASLRFLNGKIQGMKTALKGE